MKIRTTINKRGYTLYWNVDRFGKKFRISREEALNKRAPKIVNPLSGCKIKKRGLTFKRLKRMGVNFKQHPLKKCRMRINSFKKCLSSRENAKECLNKLEEKFPGISGLVVSRNFIYGVVRPSGALERVEEPIPVEENINVPIVVEGVEEAIRDMEYAPPARINTLDEIRAGLRSATTDQLNEAQLLMKKIKCQNQGLIYDEILKMCVSEEHYIGEIKDIIKEYKQQRAEFRAQLNTIALELSDLAQKHASETEIDNALVQFDNTMTQLINLCIFVINKLNDKRIQFEKSEMNVEYINEYIRFVEGDKLVFETEANKLKKEYFTLEKEEQEELLYSAQHEYIPHKGIYVGSAPNIKESIEKFEEDAIELQSAILELESDIADVEHERELVETVEEKENLERAKEELYFEKAELEQQQKIMKEEIIQNKKLRDVISESYAQEPLYSEIEEESIELKPLDPLNNLKNIQIAKENDEICKTIGMRFNIKKKKCVLPQKISVKKGPQKSAFQLSLEQKFRSVTPPEEESESEEEWE